MPVLMRPRSREGRHWDVIVHMQGTQLAGHKRAREEVEIELNK